MQVRSKRLVQTGNYACKQSCNRCHDNPQTELHVRCGKTNIMNIMKCYTFFVSFRHSPSSKTQFRQFWRFLPVGVIPSRAAQWQMWAEVWVMTRCTADAPPNARRGCSQQLQSGRQLLRSTTTGVRGFPLVSVLLKSGNGGPTAVPPSGHRRVAQTVPALALFGGDVARWPAQDHETRNCCETSSVQFAFTS